MARGGTRAAEARTRAVVVLLLGAFATLVAVLAWRSRGWPLVHDAPIMHYIAWRIGEGAAPYRDLFDMNAPGVYLVHLALLRTLGDGDVAWRVFDLAWLVGGAAAVAALAAPWSAVAAAGGALFFAAHHLAGGAWQAGQRDFLLCPFLLAGALGVTRWLEARAAARRGESGGGGPPAAGVAAAGRAPTRQGLLWGGLALGAGATLKPHALLFAAALGCVVVVAGWRDGAMAPAATFAVSIMVPPLVAVGWVAALGALPAWRSIVLDYLLLLYSRLGRPGQWSFHRWPVWIPIAAVVAASLASAAAHRRFGPRHAIAALGLAYGVAHYVGQGKGWEYHLYPLAAFASVLLFSEVEPLLRARRPVVGGLVTAGLVLVAVLLGFKGAEAAAAAEGGWITAKEHRVAALVLDLGARLRPGDLVQVLDTTDGGIHALLRLHARQPTRFLYDFHFFHDPATREIRALRAEFVHDLASRPPRFVVLLEHGWPTGGYERVEGFPALRDLLAAAYRPIARGDGYVIYAKRDDP